MTSFLSAEGRLIWIELRRLVQNDMSTAVIWSKSKSDVEFQYGGRLSEFHCMSSQSHLPHYRVRAATWRIQCHDPRAICHIAGCCTGRIQRHVVPEPRITLQGAATWWIHCHDSRATCHIAGYSHLAKSISWSYHIAGCNNSIRHTENRFSPYIIIFFCFLMQFGLWRAAAFVSYLIHLFLLSTIVAAHRAASL